MVSYEWSKPVCVPALFSKISRAFSLPGEFKNELSLSHPPKFLSELKRRLPALEGVRHRWQGPAPGDSLWCCPDTVWGQMAQCRARTTTGSGPIAMLHTWNSCDRCVNYSQLHTEREDTEDTGRDNAHSGTGLKQVICAALSCWFRRKLLVVYEPEITHLPEDIFFF